MEHGAGFVDQLILVFAASVAAAALFWRLRIPTLVCYLLVGALLGPGLGLVTAVGEFRFIAEFGVAFLLFTLGLEFSLPRLLALRRWVFGMGLAQVGICVLLFAALILATAGLYPVGATGALVAAGALALSSTAVVTRELAQRGEVATAHGAMAIGVLLFQDIAAVVMLVLVEAGQGELAALGGAAVRALAFFAAVVLVGRHLLPALFAEIARTRSEELFVLAVLLVALLATAAAARLGLSPALGAFMAGMMLGESHFRHQIEADIRPFRDVLLGIFFVSVGLLIDLSLIAAHWPRILFFTLCLLAFKGILIAFLARLFGAGLHEAVRTGVILAQGGEFGFALLALAEGEGLLSADMASFFLSIILLSMAATPFLVAQSRRIAAWLARPGPEEETLPEADTEHVILCGYGRVGQTIARFLDLEGIPWRAVDDDPVRVARARALGQPVLFGNAARPTVLGHLGLKRAILVVISFDDVAAALSILALVRRVRPDLPVLVRTRDDAHLDRLRAAGATEVIPETLEAALMLVSHVMAALGLPADRVLERIRAVREERYRLLRGLVAGVGPEEATGRLLPLYLPPDAAAVDHSLEELALESLGVRVHTVKRGEELIVHPAADVRLAAGDIVVLAGDAPALERAERRLLSGS